MDILLSGRHTGPPGTPMALETEFGWVLCGGTERGTHADQISVHSTAFHTAVHQGHISLLFPKGKKLLSPFRFTALVTHAYAGVVYLRTVDSVGNVDTSLVMSKTNLRCLPSNGYLSHVSSSVVPMSSHASFNAPKKCFRCQCPTYMYMLGLIVLNWLVGNPRRFKTYVGNRVSAIIDLIPGIMFLGLKIQQIAHLEAFSLLSCWFTTFGGMVLRGCNRCSPTGRNSMKFLRILILKRRRRSVWSPC